MCLYIEETEDKQREREFLSEEKGSRHLWQEKDEVKVDG